jgi:hypothetical protein
LGIGDCGSLGIDDSWRLRIIGVREDATSLLYLFIFLLLNIQFFNSTAVLQWKFKRDKQVHKLIKIKSINGINPDKMTVRSIDNTPI